jgi:AcrR family transcriptional regulator
MAKRQARFTQQDVEDDPRLRDDSPDLWDQSQSDVVRGLLTSAVRCFASNGYHATTTRDISAGVGLSPAALYVHFSSKELVLFEIIRAAHQSALAYIQDPVVDEAADDVSRLHVMMSRYTEWHARHHVAARVSQYELAGLTAEHYDEIMQLRQQTNEVFRDAVERGVKSGAFAAVDVNRVVRGMLSLSIDLIRWYRLNGPDSPEQMGEFYAELALKMVMAPATSRQRPGQRATRGNGRQ